MKRTIFLAVIILSSILGTAQNKTIPGSFVIKDLKEGNKLSFYTIAIEGANFEELRLKNKSQEFKFENGFILELISATELKSKGVSVDLTNYKEELDKDFQTPLFKISEDGKLVAMYASMPTKYDIKMNSTNSK